MSGKGIMTVKTWRIALVVLATLGLSACDENGNFPTAGQKSASDAPTAQSGRSRVTEQDVERPDIFETTDRGLWDGRPSLGGVWVAHPDVSDPERVIIRNTANGKSIVGALFRRERENPGPALQVSSDAAEALEMLAGAPSELNVIVLRREEVEEDVPQGEENPVVADLAAPVTVEATPLEPVAGAALAVEAVADPVIVDLPPAPPAVDASAALVPLPVPLPAPDSGEEAAAEPQTAASAPLVITGPSVQIGIFSVQANADAAAALLNGSGIVTAVAPQEAGGRTVWRVVAGPFEDAASRDTAITQIKELGFVDAFAIDS